MATKIARTRYDFFNINNYIQNKTSVSYIVYIVLHLFRWDINEERNGELDKANTAIAIFTHPLQHIVKNNK